MKAQGSLQSCAALLNNAHERLWNVQHRASMGPRRNRAVASWLFPSNRIARGSHSSRRWRVWISRFSEMCNSCLIWSPARVVRCSCGL